MTCSVMRQWPVRLLVVALVLSMACLSACSLGSLRPTVPTAAQILQRATRTLDVNVPQSATDSTSTTVQDLTYTMTFAVNSDLSTSHGTSQFSQTLTAHGKEALHPRRGQMDMTISTTSRLSYLFGGSTPTTATIIVDYGGHATYMKSAALDSLFGSAGKWYKTTLAAGGGLGADTSLYIDYSKLKDAKLIGSETINGVAVWHLQAKEDLNQTLQGSGKASGSSRMATADYYFRQDNYRPVKVVITGMSTFSDSAGHGTMTLHGEMDFTAFNTGINIALPPASDVEPFGS